MEERYRRRPVHGTYHTKSITQSPYEPSAWRSFAKGVRWWRSVRRQRKDSTDVAMAIQTLHSFAIMNRRQRLRAATFRVSKQA